MTIPIRSFETFVELLKAIPDRDQTHIELQVETGVASEVKYAAVFRVCVGAPGEQVTYTSDSLFFAQALCREMRTRGHTCCVEFGMAARVVR